MYRFLDEFLEFLFFLFIPCAHRVLLKVRVVWKNVSGGGRVDGRWKSGQVASDGVRNWCYNLVLMSMSSEITV